MEHPVITQEEHGRAVAELRQEADLRRMRATLATLKTEFNHGSHKGSFLGATLTAQILCLEDLIERTGKEGY